MSYPTLGVIKRLAITAGVIVVWLLITRALALLVAVVSTNPYSPAIRPEATYWDIGLPLWSWVIFGIIGALATAMTIAISAFIAVGILDGLDSLRYWLFTPTPSEIMKDEERERMKVERTQAQIAEAGRIAAIGLARDALHRIGYNSAILTEAALADIGEKLATDKPLTLADLGLEIPARNLLDVDETPLEERVIMSVGSERAA